MFFFFFQSSSFLFDWSNKSNKKGAKEAICVQVCNKRYQCGKALGSHIRIHMNYNSIEVEEVEANSNVVKFPKEQERFRVAKAFNHWKISVVNSYNLYNKK